MTTPTVHGWYARPVLFVADLNRSLHFYVDMLGFWKKWHEGDAAGTVCQVNRGDCEIILCQDAARRDKARFFVHGDEQPTLVVNDVKSGASAKGAIALWVGPGTIVHFRNVTVTP